MDIKSYKIAIGAPTNNDERICINRIESFIKGSSDYSFSDQDEESFAYEIGEKYEKPGWDFDIFDSPTGLQKAWPYLSKHTKNFSDFLFCIVALINTYSGEKSEKKAIIQAIEKIFKDSYIEIEILEDADGIFIFPKGAKELDDALVSEPLRWLKSYPKAQKTYIIALKQYSEGVYIRDVADNLRKTLEAFLQEFLGNTKNLETNKNEICKYLGEQGVDAGVSGLFQPLINAYKNINDRIAKHNDAVDEKLLEFLLYQTGVLIRMVLSVKMSEDS